MEKAVVFRTIMNDPYREHPSEDALERFLFNQSEDEELEIVETHFLACEVCVTRLEVLELHVAATKLALRNLQAEEIKKIAQPASNRRGWFSWLSVPQLSFAGAALAACAIVVSFVSVPRDVSLVAERGNETKTVSKWVPLHLHLEAHDLKSGPVTVEAVDESGKPIWQESASVRNEDISLKAPPLRSSGKYFVRVYEPAAGDPLGTLVREYHVQATLAF